MMNEQLYFNGINGATGEYLLSLSETQLTQTILQSSLSEDTSTKRRVMSSVEVEDLAQTGWGIIFTDKTKKHIQPIREALDPLIKWRMTQSGERGKIFIGVDGYREGETVLCFLNRHNVAPGLVDPTKLDDGKGLPYYLLIVGSPEEIPYEFQYHLDIQYGVGRLYFDQVEDYRQYADQVVAIEQQASDLSKPKLSLFGVANQNDRATQLSRKYLIKPLSEKLPKRLPTGDTEWEIELLVDDRATHSHLDGLFGGKDTPNLLVTASHGMGFPMGDTRQLPHQGALLCQDWPGERKWRKPIPEDFYFAGEHLSQDVNLNGLITLHFACYSAGTPQVDNFAMNGPQQIAAKPFVAQLPQKLLTHGALAIIGQVDRAWGYAFHWPGAGEQTAAFEAVLESLMEGKPVGAAVDFFNERYAELAAHLSGVWGKAKQTDQSYNTELNGLWVAARDARNLIVFGDPAVRLPIKGTQQTNQANLSSKSTDKEMLPKPIIDKAVIQDYPPLKLIQNLSDGDWHMTPNQVQKFVMAVINRADDLG